MPIERVTAAESAAITVVPEMSKSEVIDFARKHDVAVWEGRATIEKYWADDTQRADPYEVVETEPNLLLTSGVTNLWNLAAGISGTAWSNSTARIAIGTGTTAAAAADTTLQTETAGARQQMVTGYPQVSANVITFQASYSTSVANVNWREMGIVNAATSGTFLNRLVGDWGTKVNSATWVATLTISLS